jgi:hypothetical protein
MGSALVVWGGLGMVRSVFGNSTYRIRQNLACRSNTEFKSIAEMYYKVPKLTPMSASASFEKTPVSKDPESASPESVKVLGVLMDPILLAEIEVDPEKSAHHVLGLLHEDLVDRFNAEFSPATPANPCLYQLFLGQFKSKTI